MTTRPSRPRQLRSQRTEQRILDAFEALLAEGGVEGLRMDALAERAHVSVGAIYKHFEGKASLLPRVLDRLHDEQLLRWRAFVAEPGRQQAGLADRVDATLAVFADAQRERQRTIRALVVGHAGLAEPDAAAHARATEMIGAIHGWLAERSDEIRHPEPTLALSIGLFAALQAIQTALLFERLPPALEPDRFVAEIARMFRRHLGVDRQADSAKAR